jgi:predicted DNA-binding transcriptional regulator YafY
MHGHTLRASYELLATGAVKYYVLRPLSLVVHHEGLHLLARKRDGAVRMFDVEGFRTIERVREATAPADRTVARYFKYAFGRYTDFPATNVELRLRGIAARQVRRRTFHTSQKSIHDDGDELTVRYRVGLCPEFMAWLLGMSPDVEVVRPRELRAELRRRHADGARLNGE